MLSQSFFLNAFDIGLSVCFYLNIGGLAIGSTETFPGGLAAKLACLAFTDLYELILLSKY